MKRGLLAGKIMADFGADVIQIEPVGGSSARKVGPFIENGIDDRAIAFLGGLCL